MMPTPDPHIQMYRRAAGHRYDAAEFLVSHGWNIDGVYLAGYVVECSLKALILANTPPKDRPAIVAETFRGKLGHDYERLRRLLRGKGVTIPTDVRQQFLRVTHWSTDLRYSSRAILTRDAERFLEAAEFIRQWMERSL